MRFYSKFKTLTAPFHALSRDNKGSVAMLFGLMAIMLFLMIGAAVDFGRWQHARKQTMAAMDAAVLAAGRSLQVNRDDHSGALAAAEAFYKDNITGRLPLVDDTISFEVVDDGLAVQAKGNAHIETPFLSLTNINKLPLIDESGTEYARSEVEGGKFARGSIELSIMLDTTGSMNGSKMRAMKDAAKDLIDIVIWDDQSRYTSKVALVPFSHAINAGSYYFNAITNKDTSSIVVDNRHLPQVQDPFLKMTIHAAMDMIKHLNPITPAYAVQGGNTSETSPSNQSNSNGNGGNDSDHNSGGGSSSDYSACVADRNGSVAVTDAPPSSGQYFDVYDIAKQNNRWTKDMACEPANVAIEPLTNNKAALKAKIDRLSAGGSTAGHLGTAFAWYMVSPRWASIWPAASRPASYNDRKTKKFVLLMSDGEYNTWYNSNRNGSSTEQAGDLCTNMKAEGVTVFAVGFGLEDGSASQATLSGCATDNSKYFDADDEDDLKQAFRAIALHISSLYLSN